MRVISTAVHGVLDYAAGILLILAPLLLGVIGAPEGTLRGFGVVLILYSLATRYEAGVLKLIPFGAHLRMDFVWGMLLAASPWLFGFAAEGTEIWWLHVAAGLAWMLLPVLSMRVRRQLVEQAPEQV